MTLASCKKEIITPGSETTIFRVSTTKLTFDAKGGIKSFSIESGSEWKITTIDKAKLITAISRTVGSGNMEITVAVAQTEPRPDQSARVIITDSHDNQAVVEVTQITERYLTVNKESLTVDSDNCVEEVEVQTNVTTLGIEI